MRRTIGRSEQDRGSATLEITILGPVIVMMTFSVIQASLWFYARSLALAAAQSGVAAGRAYGADGDIAQAQAQTFLTAQAGDSLQDARVSTSGTTATVVRVEVSGRCLTVLPGFTLTVRQTAQAERERFTAPTPSRP